MLKLSDSTPADHSSVEPEPKPTQHFGPLAVISALNSCTWHFTSVC